MASFFRHKTMFFTQYYAPEHTEQDQIDLKWLEKKKLIFPCKCWRVGRILIIANKSMKNRRFDFFSVGWNFNSLMNTKTCIFTSGYRHSWKYNIWCSFGEIKFDLTLKKSNCVLYLIRAFTVRKQNHWTLQTVSVGVNAWMRLCARVKWIWICAFCACSKTHFQLAWSI